MTIIIVTEQLMRRLNPILAMGPITIEKHAGFTTGACTTGDWRCH